MSKRKIILENCIVQPYDIHRFMLLEDFEFNGHVVPKGYITNGANTPRFAWFIYPPNRPDYLPAAIIHDYLCDNMDFIEADKQFRLCLKDLDIDPITIQIFHKGVLVYHLFRYHIPNKIMKKLK